MSFKQIYVKNIRTASSHGLPWQQLKWYGFNQHNIVFLDKFYEKSFIVIVAVFVAKIYESLKVLRALCASTPRVRFCKIILAKCLRLSFVKHSKNEKVKTMCFLCLRWNRLDFTMAFTN